MLYYTSSNLSSFYNLYSSPLRREFVFHTMTQPRINKATSQRLEKIKHFYRAYLIITVGKYWLLQVAMRHFVATGVLVTCTQKSTIQFSRG